MNSLLQRTSRGSIQSGGTIPAEVGEPIEIPDRPLGRLRLLLDEGEEHVERTAERNACVLGRGPDRRIIGSEPGGWDSDRARSW